MAQIENDTPSRQPTLNYASPNTIPIPGRGWRWRMTLIAVLLGLQFVGSVLVLFPGLLGSAVPSFNGAGLKALAYLILPLPFLAVSLCPTAKDRAGDARQRRLAIYAGYLSVLAIAASLLVLPFAERRRDSLVSRPPSRWKCGSNLRQIGQAIKLHANDFKGTFPADLPELLFTEDILSDVLICPQSPNTPATAPTTRQIVATLRSTTLHCSYIYLGKGLTDKTVTPAHVLAYEPLTNHGAGMNVLFGDGSVQWLQLAEANYLLAELKAGCNPPRPPATNVR